ncbi:hypothetical protein PIB30_075735 [Stylosanthes scabra]|uniref:Uncharacterized protein n=1 Tax=Stylosanthes scabra TaxID=79078 RepID=A0ABU6RPY0_9FABA|nr:hypothetical protein [Stylosanthes scabra]
MVGVAAMVEDEAVTKDDRTAKVETKSSGVLETTDRSIGSGGGDPRRIGAAFHWDRVEARTRTEQEKAVAGVHINVVGETVPGSGGGVQRKERQLCSVFSTKNVSAKASPELVVLTPLQNLGFQGVFQAQAKYDLDQNVFERELKFFFQTQSDTIKGGR